MYININTGPNYVFSNKKKTGQFQHIYLSSITAHKLYGVNFYTEDWVLKMTVKIESFRIQLNQNIARLK